MTDLTLAKIKNMLGAHNDGVYRLQARENLGEIVGWLVARLEGYAERLAELETQKSVWEQAFNEMKHQRDEVIAKRDNEIAKAHWAAS